MKNIFKKLICTVLIISFVSVPSFLAQAFQECGCDNAPIIYIKGRAAINEDKDDMNSRELVSYDANTITDNLPSLLWTYYKCYKKDDFSDFAHQFTDVINEVYSGYALNKDGELANKSGRVPIYQWRELDPNTPSQKLTLYKWNEYKYNPDHTFTGLDHTPLQAYKNLYRYAYNYDARLDPVTIADDLHEFIQFMKEMTGHTKFKFVCRCLGTTILTTYFLKYGYDCVEDVVYYNPLYNGAAIANGLFTGNLYCDTNGVDNVANEFLDTSPALSLLAQIISMANSTYHLDMTFNYFNKTLPKVGKQVIPEVLRAVYATCPGYWAMVSYDKYEEARDFVFDGYKDEYAGVIKKTDNYHYNYAGKMNGIIKEMASNGVNVYFIAKYNCQMYPLTSAEYTRTNSDNVIMVAQQAYGTIAADMGETLSESYIKAQTDKGLAKYISPDKIIDASGTIVPDRTWYIKDLDHDSFPYIVDPMIEAILRSNGTYDVNTDARYPQFLTYEGELDDGDAIYPQTEEHMGKSYKVKTFTEVIKSMFQIIIDSIKSFFQNIFN